MLGERLNLEISSRVEVVSIEGFDSSIWSWVKRADTVGFVASIWSQVLNFIDFCSSVENKSTGPLIVRPWGTWQTITVLYASL